jgi:N-acylneuraminate cytidylyltransferase/CMP-N,N'-diacetyllegionaminic acid synthase
VRRQDFEELYRPNGAIYITKADVIVTQKSFQTEKTAAYTMDAISSIDIDTKDDFELAEYYIRKHM